MERRHRYGLSEAEKDALLDDQSALIDAQAARIKELEAALSAPKKTCDEMDAFLNIPKLVRITRSFFRSPHSTSLHVTPI